MAADDLPFSLMLSHSEGRKTKYFTPLAREAGEERRSGRSEAWEVFYKKPILTNPKTIFKLKVQREQKTYRSKKLIRKAPFCHT